MFKMEQEEYTKDEIDWSYIGFVDNQDVLDLIEKVSLPSLFPLLFLFNLTALSGSNSSLLHVRKHRSKKPLIS